MHKHTGAIVRLESGQATPEDYRQLKNPEAQRLLRMGRKQRLEWLQFQQLRETAKAQLSRHPAARTAGETDVDHRKARNARKRIRRSRG